MKYGIMAAVLLTASVSTSLVGEEAAVETYSTSTSYLNTRNGITALTADDICLFDENGELLTSEPAGGAIRMGNVMTDDALYYSTESGIYAFDLDNNEISNLVELDSCDIFGLIGDELYFSYLPAGNYEEDIEVAAIDLTSNTLIEYGYFENSCMHSGFATWGSYIIYNQGAGDVGSTALYLYDTANKTRTTIAEESGFWSVWGDQILYMEADKPCDLSTYDLTLTSFDLDTMEKKAITEGTYSEIGHVVAADENTAYLLSSDYQANKSTIREISLVDGSQKDVCAIDGICNQAYKNEGDIYYSVYGNSSYPIYRMSLETGENIELANPSDYVYALNDFLYVTVRWDNGKTDVSYDYYE